MSKSKCDIELEKMEAERNYWRDLAKKRGVEIQDLRNRIERQAITTSAITRGALPELEQSYARLQTERDEWREEAAALRGILTSTTPGWVITQEQIEPGTVEIGIGLILRYGNEPTEWKATSLSKTFYGTYDDAFNEVLPAVVLAAARVPEPSDIMPKGELPGLTKADIQTVLHDLAAVYWRDDEKEYERLRGEAFDNYWPIMKKNERGKELIPDRNKLHTQFNTAIDGAFRRLRERRGKQHDMLEPGEWRNQTLNV